MYIVYQFLGFIQSVTEKATCLNSLFYMEDSNVESALWSLNLNTFDLSLRLIKIFLVEPVFQPNFKLKETKINKTYIL